MSNTHQEALAAKAEAVREFEKGKKARRKRIAEAVAADPDYAMLCAKKTLARKTDPGVQWSRQAWAALVDACEIDEIIHLLMHPGQNEEALSDSHPFGGILDGRKLHS